MRRVAIVGAGIAGLACARALAAGGVDVVVFEKSRGPGGRTSTRRAGDARWDHGAPSFSVGDPRFRRAVEGWRARGAVVPLDAGLWTATPGSNAIAKLLAEGLDLRTGVRAELPLPGFDAVVLAAPVPQGIALLPEGHAWRDRLARVRYEGHFALLARWDPAPETGIHDARVADGPLARAVRRVDGHPGCWVLHGRPTTDLERDPDEVAAELLAAFARALRVVLPDPAESHLHRWRYARCIEPLGEDCLWDPDARLGMCGDGLRGDGVENAWLSGAALASEMLHGAITAETPRRGA